ncbi:MAG: hypothetical protein KIS77_18480 [Saprospiraceae bacterium]|nr:hypothetical protein [Saprospiraceae bacterium]
MKAHAIIDPYARQTGPKGYQEQLFKAGIGKKRGRVVNQKMIFHIQCFWFENSR